MCVMDGSIPSRSAIYRENTAVELQNFAIVAQVSIDTAAQHCEVRNSVAVILWIETHAYACGFYGWTHSLHGANKPGS